MLKLYGSEALQKALLFGAEALGLDELDIDVDRARTMWREGSWAIAVPALVRRRRSPAARARSSATSSPSGCSASATCRSRSIGPSRCVAPVVAFADGLHAPRDRRGTRAALRARRVLGRPTAWARCSPTGSATTRPIIRSPCARIASRTAARSATSTRSRAASRPGMRARGIGARRRGRVPAPELARGRGDLLRDRVSRRGRRADRALLRSEGGRLHPAQDAREGARHRRPLRRTRTSSRTSTRCAPSCPTSSGSRSSATHGATRPTSIRVRRSRRATSRSTTSPAVDPRAPALVAYTSGTTSDPKGVVHSHRTINAEIHQLAARCRDNRGGPGDDHRRAGRARHRHARRAAHPGVPAAARSTSSTCGIRAACCRRCSTTTCRPGRARRTSSRACSTIPTSIPSAHVAAHAVHRARRFGGAGRGRRAVRARSASRSRAASARPSTRRSPAARPTRRTTSASNTDGAPLPGVEIRLVDDDGNDVEVGRAGRDLEPRARTVRRLHRRRRDRRPRSAPTAGS